jgi:transposase
MNEAPQMTHIRLDAIPLLLGVLMQMGIPQIYDQEIGTHGSHTGLSGGWTITIWLAFILSQADHTKYKVEEWVARHQMLLIGLTLQRIRPSEFSDNRLSRVLARLSKWTRWERFEEALWKHSVAVYQLEMPSVGGVYSAHVDTTTACGYHVPQEGGLMQWGHSKDHRPDLVQLKLVSVATHPHGHLAATQVVQGNVADDGLYLPIIARARGIFNRTGMLYVGDSKMAALKTRATIAHDADYYLTVAPLTGETAQLLPDWITAAVAGTQPTVRISQGAGKVVGRGYEFERSASAEVPVGTEGAGAPFTWRERVQVFRSTAHASPQFTALTRRVAKAKAALLALTPKPKPGCRQFREEASLEEAIRATLKHHEVEGLLKVGWRVEQKVVARYPGRGRPTAASQPQEVSTRRCQITHVRRDPVALAAKRQRLGWRVQLTNVPAVVSLQTCVTHYRGNWCGERNYHRLKSQPLGIDTLFVRKDDQIAGLTYLLTLAARVESVIEFQVARGLKDENSQMKGLYSGLPHKTTPTPTTVAILAAIARSEITLTQIAWQGHMAFHLSPLPELLSKVLHYLTLPVSLYTKEL